MKVIVAKDQKAFLDHYRIRGEVFIKEQEIPWELEFDKDDYQSVLFVLYDNGTPIGAARLCGDKVGRVAVLEEHRRKNSGTFLMEHLEEHARIMGYKELFLGAQTYIIPFYEALGYEAYGEIYLDAGIEHRKMKKKL